MYLLTGLGIFLYQSLDAIDGKQARRTNSSSPLGELFDHGCDSVSAGKPISSHELSPLSFSLCCSVRHIGMLLRRTTRPSSLADVLVLRVVVLDVLLCPLANVRFGKTSIRKVTEAKRSRRIFSFMPFM